MNNFVKAIEISKYTLSNIDFMLQNRLKNTYFTRGTGKLNFENLVLFVLNFVKKSLQLELDNFFKNVVRSDMKITKQAYSQAREKISPDAFKIMDKNVISWLYSNENNYKTFKGYRLSAIDGTVLELNNSKRLREEYGYVENKTIKVARALASGIYDIENNIMLTAKITKYKTSERDLAKDLIGQLKEIGLKNDLILFDRGYPSKDFIEYLETTGIKYLMRVQKKFMQEVNEAIKDDQIIEFTSNGKVIKSRVVRVVLENGNEEILMTNLFEDSLTTNDLKVLYFKRWGIETKFKEVKCCLQIENFTGDTSISVEQDFYASMYLINMASIAKNDANENIKETNANKNLKYEYKANSNILIGKLKDSLVMMLIENEPSIRNEMLDSIMDEIQRNLIPIRIDRKFKRNMGLKVNRHPLNRKRCL